MEKKTMGSFIAALRKTSGMTQQEMADKLYISNKAVSRWERDECSPDLSLIPAIAEMFGVSYDELLKGERITGSADTEKPSPKIDKQIKQILNRSISNFKSAIYIAGASNFIGFVLLLAISYGFYKPIIGFAVLMVFVITSVIITLLSLNKLNDQTKNSELFDNLTEADAIYFKKSRYRYTFVSALICVMSFLWSLPFIMIQDKFFANSVIVFDEYLRFVPLFILITILIYFVFDAVCRRVFLGETRIFKIEKQTKALNILQLVISIIVFLISIIVNIISHTASIDFPLSSLRGLSLLSFIVVLLLFGALSTVYFAIKKKEDYKLIIITGLRNIGCFIAVTGILTAYFSMQTYLEYYGWQILILAVSILGYSLLKRYWIKK